MKRALALLLLTALLAGAPAHGDDAPQPGEKEEAPDPEELARQQRFADTAAGDALDHIRKSGIEDVMAGLDMLSRVQSAAVTTEVVDIAVGRRELHVAEFAGFALAAADPAGAVAACAAKLETIPGKRTEQQLVQVCGLLSELPPDGAVPLLAGSRLLHSRNATVKREAIRALGTHRSAEVVATAIDVLSSRDAHLRNAACVALGHVGDARAVIPLLSLLDKKDGGTAGFAAIALGRLEDDRIFPSIASRAGSGNTIDKGKALVAAARENHVDKLTAMARGGSPDVRIAACAALGKIGAGPLDTQKTLLSAMLDGRDRWVQTAAFSALGRCATGELAPVLAKRMGQRDPIKQMFAFEIAGDIRCTEALPAIERAMWGEKVPTLRRVAINAFWRIRDPDAITRAEKKIRGAKGRSVGRAAEVLALRRNMNGFRLALELIPKHKAGSKQQRAIEWALEMQTGHFFGPDVAVWNEWIEKNDKFFEKEQQAIEREKWREEFLEENKGPAVTPETEQTVQRALDYLARHQDGSGAFDQQHYLKLCEQKHPCPTGDGARVQMEPIGNTGLCMLALFGAGCNPSEGRYRGVLSRATEYLLSRQMPIGDYSPNDLIGGYNRPIALQAYAEAAMTTKDPIFLPFVQRGVDFLAAIQAKKGGWRYRVVDNANDTSVVSWVLFGSKAAQKAGAHVRQSIFEGCDIVLWNDQTHPKDEREDFLRDIDPRYEFEVGQGTKYQFHTGYQDSKFTKNQATTPLGLMSRILLGYRRSHPFCIGSANKILAHQLPQLPKKEGHWDGYVLDRQYPMYFLYYGTLSMHQMGGRYFREWNKRVKEILPEVQRKDGCRRGSYAGWFLDGVFGSLYTTAMGALTLETYYRYAPVLQD